MAEIILGPVAELILGKLASFASDQVRLLRNLKPEILKLKVTVADIQAVLLDAEKKQSHTRLVKLWLEKISDVMYDAEDLLDDLSTEVALQKQAVTHRRAGRAATCWSTVCSPDSSLPKQLLYDFKMARDIKAIREKLDVIAKDKEAFKLEVGIEVKALPSFRETNACPPKFVIGRDDDKKNIIELLLNCNPEANISVVPIVGMGGMGKSTLAQLVYDDHQVQHLFDIKAWVYVSQSFNDKVILRKMLESITRQKVGDLTSDGLQAQLRGIIKGKRFMFVLDDAWEESRRSWESLGKYLTGGALGSKVLVTTRSTKVAEVVAETLKSETSTSIVEPYHLNGLSGKECWNLLVKMADPNKVPQETQVQETGKKILNKCCGVPLAVSTIAAVLIDSKDPKIDWASFVQKGLPSIIRNGEEDYTMSALKHSFNHLPSHMKHCFAYCKLFPKGFQFNVQMLVQLWVAQGYINSEDEGLNCFKTLWWRSFFQEVEMDGLGKFLTCRMHDLMHDLAESIAGDNIKRSSSVLKNVSSKVRHLCITHGGNDNLRQDDHSGGDELGSMSKVRTLICFKPLSKEELQQILNNFLRLRVLVICSYDENVYTALNLLGRLRHLRYLGMEGFNNLERIQDSIINLVNLQVLKVINRKSWTETILGPVVEVILGKLGSFESDQVRLCTLKPEIQKLEDTVAAILAVLLDAENKKSHNHQVKLWPERISDIMYDVDDLLDDFSTEAALQKQEQTHWRAMGMAATCWSTVCSPISSLPKQLMYHFKMARDIMAIRGKLDAILIEKYAFKLEVGTEVKALPSFRESGVYPPTIVIGRDDDKKNIIELLLNSNCKANISVVPIVGMRGLGKTTLAQLVYHDVQVQHHFDIKGWVDVKRDIDVKMILLKMLELVTRRKVRDLRLDDLQAQLRREIEGKRFLFVLDDVRLERDVEVEIRHSWEELGNYLAVGALGSKVLLTTRADTVAKHAVGALKSRTSTSIIEPYPLKGLSEDESWKLFEEKALPRQVPAEVQDIGKQILRQCGGVPLAVSNIAGALAASTDPVVEWPSFLEKDLWSIMNEGEEDKIMDFLQKQCFNQLPSHMKRCFTYCGLFEKGFRFEIPMLVQLWVAQGYIESEDEGYDCCNTLWRSSCFKKVEFDELGNLSTCRMHELMHDLASSIAGKNIKRSSSLSVLKNVPSMVRHLCITRGDNGLRHEGRGGANELGSTSKVRTLICFKPLSNEELEQVLNNFLRLRVLVICSYDEEAYTSLRFIGKLKHLRYLGMIGFNKMKKLSGSIVNLVNLQVLNLIGGESLEELPRDIKKLANLKHTKKVG